MSQTAMTSPALTQSPSHLPLEVEGTLPAELDGYFLQACPHPAGGRDRSPLISGIRISGGQAELYRATDNGIEHLTAGLPALEISTERYRIVVELPVVADRAAALLGSPERVVWQPDRATRIGVIPTDGGAGRWFTVDPCHISRIVNAYEDGDRIVLDAVRDNRVCRWELDPSAGTARARWLTGVVGKTTVDGRRHRNIFSTSVTEDGSAVVARHDLSTWESTERSLGVDLRISQPAYVPGGWLLALVEDPVHRRAALLVLDATDLAVRAVVHVPLAMRASDRVCFVA